MHRFFNTTFLIPVILLLLTGCGGTYVDDKDNFERALRFDRPTDVQLVKSMYWQSSHFTDEHCYYLELQPQTNSTIFQTLTNLTPVVLNTLTNGQALVPETLVIDRPEWFAPEPAAKYELWTSTNEFIPFGIIRNLSSGKIFVYGQIL